VAVVVASDGRDSSMKVCVVEQPTFQAPQSPGIRSASSSSNFPVRTTCCGVYRPISAPVDAPNPRVLVFSKSRRVNCSEQPELCRIRRSLFSSPRTGEDLMFLLCRKLFTPAKRLQGSDTSRCQVSRLTAALSPFTPIPRHGADTFGSPRNQGPLLDGFTVGLLPTIWGSKIDLYESREAIIVEPLSSDVVGREVSSIAAFVTTSV
jgi:hypothetical protein